jgi:hypothetical protein
LMALKAGRPAFFGIKAPVDCDECGDEKAARRRCMRCKAAVCIYHVCEGGHRHAQEQAAKAATP